MNNAPVSSRHVGMRPLSIEVKKDSCGDESVCLDVENLVPPTFRLIMSLVNVCDIL